MQFRIPTYVFQRPGGYTAHPLFFPGICKTDANLNRLLTKLARQSVERLEWLAHKSRHDELASWTFSPAISTQRVSLEIPLRRRTARVKYLVATFRHLKRKLAFTPSVPDLWFEVSRNEKLEDRTLAVLSEHWRKIEREATDDEEVKPEEGGLEGKAWIQVLQLTATVPLVIPKPPEHKFLSLGSDTQPDGSTELRRVGRCLDWLYPDELERAVLRDRESTELERLLEERDRRPVLLCGPRQAGKTTIVHECVYRRVARRKSIHVQTGNVWLVSPQRLISGMSYVGQWEGRLLAILKHAAKRDHVLYFDDLIGLFVAGLSSQSSLSAAIVLKPYLERREVRVLGEVTPEGLRVLQERDRGFADLFHTIPVREPSDAESLRILIHQQRGLEGKHECRFGLDVLPGVFDLERRYNRTASFPGKAAFVLARLAIRASTAEPPQDSKTRGRKRGQQEPFSERPAISRDDVLADFAARSGMSLAFLDPRARLDRDAVRNQLQEQVVGQADAVEALADVVSVAKARLNDPERPLATFLFLGPTGVGKTESAKAIARVLFGDSERLLRFDLNEFNQPGAATRLVGTLAQPEGLLTSAVRRQPFAVILLDEVEKAHPDVHDLLLQVLGEGRLTDSLGRTADFTNSIIIMTSNLGVREAEANLGFVTAGDRSTAYLRAGERFFRPEFFNRIDRVIPFRTLTRDELGRIARRLVARVLAREGFSQRNCVLNVYPEALERVIDAGYDPALVARAMKRGIERELTQPAADRLAALRPGDLTIVSVHAAESGLRVDVQAPRLIEKVALSTGENVPLAKRMEEIRTALDDLQERVAELRPTQPVLSGKVTPEQERYFSLKELVAALSSEWDAIEARLESRRNSSFESGQPESLARRTRYRYVRGPKGYARDGLSALRLGMSAFGMEEAIRELLETTEPLPGNPELFDLENRLALLKVMITAPPDDRPVLFRIRGFPEGSSDTTAAGLGELYRTSWQEGLGLEVESVTRDRPPRCEADCFLLLKGIHASALALTEVGTHLVVPKQGGPVPLRVEVVETWPPNLDDSRIFGPIVRFYPVGQAIVDVRTGLICPPPFSPELFRAFTLAALPRSNATPASPSE